MKLNENNSIIFKLISSKYVPAYNAALFTSNYLNYNWNNELDYIESNLVSLLLNFPKIFSNILPFALFFSFSYVIAKYELNNELLIYWNFGISKISFVNFFLFCSLVIFLIQLFLTAFIVPN